MAASFLKHVVLLFALAAAVAAAYQRWPTGTGLASFFAAFVLVGVGLLHLSDRRPRTFFVLAGYGWTLVSMWALNNGLAEGAVLRGLGETALDRLLSPTIGPPVAAGLVVVALLIAACDTQLARFLKARMRSERPGG